MSELGGIRVVVNEALNGTNKAVMLNGEISVSLAMMNEMKTASPEELQRLLAGVVVIDLGETPEWLKDEWPKRGGVIGELSNGSGT